VETHELEQALLGGPRRYTRQQVAEVTGVRLEEARRLWRAMGFPNVGDEPIAFTDADVDALHRLDRLVAAGEIDADFAVRLTRAMGQTLARLAEWQVDTFVDNVARTPASVAGGAGVPQAAVERAARLLPDLEHLLVYVWRRQLAAAAGRMLTAADSELAAGALTVGFADLVGFTRLSRRLEEEQLAQLVEGFETRAADVVAASGARLVKTLGDEVLFVADTAVTAAEVALQIAETMTADPLVPDVRVGVASGTVLSRMGDVFGTTVNRASRLTSLARRGTVLVDRETVDALADEPAYEVSWLWRRPVRGLGLVEAASLRRGGVTTLDA
jgi:class 3 adenylate cyclase